MTATKAVAGGVAGALITVATWLLSLIPGWEQIPFEPKAAILELVTISIGAGIVYFAPANKQTVNEDASMTPPRHTEKEVP